MELIELTKADPDLDGFLFAIRAMYPETHANKNICFHVCLKIQDGAITGTDGKILHVYQAEETFKNGVYRVLKRLKTHVVALMEKESDYKKGYPPFDTLTDLPDSVGTESFEGNYPNSDPGITPSLTEIVRRLPSSMTINPAFLKDLDGAFTTFYNKKLRHVFFVGPREKAAIVLTEHERTLF